MGQLQNKRSPFGTVKLAISQPAPVFLSQGKRGDGAGRRNRGYSGAEATCTSQTVTARSPEEEADLSKSRGCAIW